MREVERRARVVELLRASGRASVAELAFGLGVTPSTIRRDLDRLARDGRLVRTYGGAAIPDRVAGPAADDPAAGAKRRIAHAASGLIVDGSTIAISSGTTALEFARVIAHRRLTVITNALDVANVLLDRDGIELIVLGGVVRPGMHSMLGHLAEAATDELRADTLFMGIGAISVEQGLMNDSVPEILVDRALRRMARTAVVLADGSKFRRVEPGYVFGLEDVDVLVTDEGIPASAAAAIRERGVRLVIASGPGPAAGPASAQDLEPGHAAASAGGATAGAPVLAGAGDGGRTGR